MDEKSRSVFISEGMALLIKIEAEKLSAISEDELVEEFSYWQHSGSWSGSKAIIDMMPVVKDISKVDTFNEAMAEAGYESRGKNGISGRRFFRKGDSLRTYYVHVYQL